MRTPAREGEGALVSSEGPQTQLYQQSCPAMWGRPVAKTFALEAVIEGHSQVSPPSSRAVFLVDVVGKRSPETSLTPGKCLEPIHLLGVHDTSVHLCLPTPRGAELTELGWAEPHLYEDFGTEYMVYGPRVDMELELVLSIIAESLSFARHSKLPTHLTTE